MKITINEISENVAWASALPLEAVLPSPDAAKFLSTFGTPVRPTTLETWRTRRSDGPRFIKHHRRVGYRVSDLRAYLGLLNVQVA
jgi:hypothetical protein